MAVILTVDIRHGESGEKRKGDVIKVILSGDEATEGSGALKDHARILYEDAELEAALLEKAVQHSGRPIIVLPFAIRQDGKIVNRSSKTFDFSHFSDATAALLGTSKDSVMDIERYSPVLSKKTVGGDNAFTPSDMVTDETSRV
jgi:hypothetical protein